MTPVTYSPIGSIRTPFKQPSGTPIQAVAGEGAEGTVEVLPEYADGLADLDGFSHVFLVYHFHLCSGHSLKVVPFLDDEPRGIFASRAPRRPNPIGISIVRLLGVEGNLLRVGDLDIIDGTPLLDIKPYVPAFDVRDGATSGWLEGRTGGIRDMRDDGRFVRRS